ncbi:MAG: hypothetical protein AVDCRST_MAG93-2669, partial [uncultured Chloroflexia bacterium]
CVMHPASICLTEPGMPSGSSSWTKPYSSTPLAKNPRTTTEGHNPSNAESRDSPALRVN